MNVTSRSICLQFIFLASLAIAGCGSDTEESFLLTTNVPTLTFSGEGGSQPLTIIMKGQSWSAISDQEWCTLSINTSQNNTTNIQVLVAKNEIPQVRLARITFTLHNGESKIVEVIQSIAEGVYPKYSSWVNRDNTGMESNSFELVSKINVGWNLGNALEVPGNETGWGNPRVTKSFIDSLKKNGINAIRLPCAWDSYIEDQMTAKIKTSWLERVKLVVDYCIQNEMYVILNIHWDGGWLENNPTYAKQKLVNAKQKALWEQIAMTFRNYDEHLLFAGTNEVHVPGEPSTENLVVQMSFNKTFVDAVRSTGGKNSYRNLIVQSYNTNIDYAVDKLIVPEDTVDSRLLVEVHYYDPWDFCGLETDASWANIKYFWGKEFAQFGEVSPWGQEEYVVTQFQKLKTKFVDNGYPIIMGEYGALRRPAIISGFQNHLNSRSHYVRYITEQSKKNGMAPFIWDNGVTGSNGFGIFNRNNGTVSDKQLLQALLEGANTSYPF